MKFYMPIFSYSGVNYYWNSAKDIRITSQLAEFDITSQIFPLKSEKVQSII